MFIYPGVKISTKISHFRALSVQPTDCDDEYPTAGVKWELLLLLFHQAQKMFMMDGVDVYITQWRSTS